MKLGILVVYFLPDERMPVLDLHLRAIGQRTSGDFVVYGVAPRVSAAVQERLQAVPWMRLLQFTPTTTVGSKEHSYYLNKLAQHAVADGCERICTMDVDAFPIVPAWNDRMEAFITEGHQLAAVFRQENDDTALPHPSCCYFTTDFYQQYRPDFLPEQGPETNPGYAEFLARTGQKIDSGIGVGQVLWQHRLKWKQLLRSNRVDDHYLLAGIYGDLIFHLGAMSWTDRDFRKDRLRSPLLRLLDRLEHWLRSSGLYQGKLGDYWRQANYMATRPLVKRTNATFQSALDSLSADPEAYVARLRGQR